MKDAAFVSKVLGFFIFLSFGTMTVLMWREANPFVFLSATTAVLGLTTVVLPD